ncbi:TetR/AcrR family transcriptional regulator [Psychrobium sp. 1_MG-2023]|uniref:TetR/AcrR family transcriptional regulator n=1 Tax=Psychrobium sp. 1_MG-2023 TaxID=3062624 RepID=UPI000C3417EF|nr:TetR/AcrR family transcriptional regulator [Psychrobium sp. 1_MG-2023]MDP2561375.1 TetR/AcrR family transcriptional regulator [Psychrobium sp. 1_MG-2023]PKF54856.1 TetR family transcriptional regulator [Alteromonadales bacterium alter-6D02]
MKLTDKKKIHILDAAEQLFYEQGVMHTSMDEIAKTAAVSKRTVYNHFATKDALFHAIIERMLTHLANTQLIEYDHTLPIKTQLMAIAVQEAELFASDNFLRVAKIAFMQMLQQADLAKQISTHKIGCMVYLEDFLKNACSAQKLTIVDFELAAQQLVYQLKSHIFYPRLYGFDIPNKTQEAYLIEQSVDLFLARYSV